MILGSTPALAYATILAIIGDPILRATSSEVTTMAAAPSLSPEAFAAVTVPSFLKAGRSLARDSLLTPPTNTYLTLK